MIINQIIIKIIILKLFLINTITIDQKLIIDLKKPSSLLLSSKSSKSKINNEINSNEHFIKQEQKGYLNVLTIEHGETSKMKKRHNNYIEEENNNNNKHYSTNNISTEKIKDMIKRLDEIFSFRFEQLSRRLDRIEANQQHLRRAALADWPSFSVDKRVRVFTHPRSNWPDAQKECTEHAGTLLEIDSETENARIDEMLTNSGSNRPQDLYWIGVQIMLQFSNGSSTNGNYSNFEEQNYFESQLQQQSSKNLMMKRCAAISASKQPESGEGGRWLSLECSEKHGFICQL